MLTSNKETKTVMAEIETISIHGLTREHIQAMVDVFQYVGGSPAKSRRKYIDDVFKILAENGVRPSTEEFGSSDTYMDTGPCSGVFFRDSK